MVPWITRENRWIENPNSIIQHVKKSLQQDKAVDAFRHENLKVPIIRSKSRTSVVHQTSVARFKKRTSADLNLCDSVSDLLLLDETMTIMDAFFRAILEGTYRLQINERIFRHKPPFEEEDHPKTEVAIIDEQKDLFEIRERFKQLQNQLKLVTSQKTKNILIEGAFVEGGTRVAPYKAGTSRPGSSNRSRGYEGADTQSDLPKEYVVDTLWTIFRKVMTIVAGSTANISYNFDEYNG